MKQFKIYANPQGTYEAVKQGWSWPAFFFVFIWAFVKKLWMLGFGVIAVIFVLGLIGDAGELENGRAALQTFGGALSSFVFGISGNEWREKNLVLRGFDFKDVVTAANGEGAIALYLKTRSAL